MNNPTVFEKHYASYLNALITGDRRHCHVIVEKILNHHSSIKDLYVHLLQRALYEVGELWEQNRISVATEHIATAITEGLLSLVYPVLFAGEHFGRKGLVACVPGEYHQIGAKMVADIFELNGWDGHFVGANTPLYDLLQKIEELKPDVVALSLSIYFNLPKFEEMLQAISQAYPGLPVFAGGQAFRWGGTEIFNKYENISYIPSLYELENKLQNNL